MKRKSKENWTKKETRTFLHERAKRAVEKENKNRADKKFRLVKISDNPPTFKEVEV